MPGEISALFIPLEAPSSNPLDFYFRRPNLDTGPTTVACSAHLAVPPNAMPAGGFDVIASRTCRVRKPLNSLAVTIGSVQASPAYPATPTAMHLYGASWVESGTTYTTGIHWRGEVTTPSEFGRTGSPGWNYTQLIKPGRALTDGSTGTIHRLVPDGVQVLDSTFGYEPVYARVYPDDGSEQNQGDRPSSPFRGTPFTNLTIHESFVTYTLYKPPGEDSVFVPLKNLDWYWQGAASPNTSGVWSISNTAAMWSFLEDFPAHPEWGPEPPWYRGNVAPLNFSPEHPLLPPNHPTTP